jgi:mono/diheme cytochrome c family protein
MTPYRKFASFGAAALLCLALAAVAYVYLASEAIIQRRYPLQSLSPHVVMTPDSIARGRHLAYVMGCADCHGGDLSGRMLDTPFSILAPDLGAAAKALSDEEFARAVRFGVTADGRSLWLMPSASYQYMSDDDLLAILAYVHSLPHKSGNVPSPSFGAAARLAILSGKVAAEAPAAFEDDTALDLGPRYDGGRYLARTSCSECHGIALTGAGATPGLDAVGRYTAKDFFDLMVRGTSRGRTPPMMSRLARTRFHALKDYEVSALYEYLRARAEGHARGLKEIPPKPTTLP